MAKNKGKVIVGNFKRPLDDSEGLPKIEDLLDEYQKKLNKLKDKDKRNIDKGPRK
jgi:predicted metal-dependent hydrolase